MIPRATCRGKGEIPGCGAEIIWATTRSGAKIPLNATPDPAGTMVIEMHGEDPIASYVGRVELDEPKYVTHWATCPFSERYRRR